MHPPQINVRMLPALIDQQSLAGSTAIVIDVLRATTTICTALQSGATKVIACQEVEFAQELRESGKVDACGGERGGIPIEGFDFGNSPLDYTAENVSGKTIAFTTTNGTRAMKACEQAKEILVASFLNLSAVAERVVINPRVEIVCAGTDGEITAEDFLLAGAIVEKLTAHKDGARLNDQAFIALNNWQQGSQAELFDRICNSQGGRNLIRLDREEDIRFASQVDLFDFVPAVNRANWEIVTEES